MLDPLSLIVRIVDKRNQTLGTGFLVFSDTLVTCSHVVQSVEKQQRGQDVPEEVDIVFENTKQKITVRVDHNLWLPWDKGDLAILRLPAKVLDQYPAFTSVDPNSLETIRTYGYPQTTAGSGLNGIGVIVGATKLLENRAVLQLSSDQITRGFSGAPVWLVSTGEIIGLVTAVTEPDSYGRLQETAFVTPISLLKTLLPELFIPERRLDKERVVRTTRPKVFVSYRRVNLDLVEKFLDKVRDELDVLMDVNNFTFGKDWKQNVDEWMSHVDVCFLMITPDIYSGGKFAEAVGYEVENCIRSGIPIIPVILSSVDAGVITSTLKQLGTERITYFEDKDDAEVTHLLDSVSALRRVSGLPKPIAAFLTVHMREIAKFFNEDSRGVWQIDTMPSAKSVNFGEKPHLATLNEDIEISGERRRLHQLLLEHGRLLLIGEAGSGKSYALHSLARKLLKALRVGNSDNVPFLVNLSSWKDDVDFPAFISNAFRWRTGEENSRSFQEILDRNRLVLLLDDIDILARRGKEAKYEQFRRFLREYPSLSVLACCRPNALLQDSGLVAIKIGNLDASQMEQIVENYTDKIAKDKFINFLRKDDLLFAMARTPFFLYLLLQLNSSKPNRFEHLIGKVEFINWYCQILKEKFFAREVIYGDSLEETETALEEIELLAYITYKFNTIRVYEGVKEIGTHRSIGLKPILQRGRAALLLLPDNNEAVYSFPHILIRNYLAASYLEKQHKKRSQNRKFLPPRFHSSSNTKNSLNLQFCVFSEVFPNWSQWKDDHAVAEAITLHVEKEDAISFESIAWGLLNFNLTELELNNLKTLIRSASPRQILHAFIAAATPDLVQFLQWKMINQIFFAIMLLHLAAAKHLIELAEHFNSMKSDRDDQSAAIKKSQKFADDESRRVVLLVSEVCGRLRLNDVVACLADFVQHRTSNSIKDAMQLLVFQQEQDMRNHNLSVSSVLDLCNTFRSHVLIADIKYLSTTLNTLLSLLNELGLYPSTAITEETVLSLMHHTNDYVRRAGFIGLFILHCRDGDIQTGEFDDNDAKEEVDMILLAATGFRTMR